MGKSNFSDKFKRDAVRQITEQGHPAAEVARRLEGERAFTLRMEEEVCCGHR